MALSFNPFIKFSTHFDTTSVQNEISLDHKLNVIKLNKKKKKEVWILRQHNTIQPGCEFRQYAIINLCGELFRLADRHLPKYRQWCHLMEDEKHHLYAQLGYLVKEMRDCESWYDYFEYKILPWSQLNRIIAPPIEGLGRGLLRKFIYYDHDFHGNNELIEDNNYAIAIDHDWCFAYLTQHFHRQMYCNIRGEAVLRKFKFNLSVRDYDNLPLIRDSNMGTYFCANDILGLMYATKMSKSQLFINEKYFSTVSFLVTQGLQNILINLHIDDARDQIKLHQHINMVFYQLVHQILPKSTGFINYFKNSYLNVIHAILFELNDFFNENLHYLPKRDKENGESLSAWRIRCYVHVFAQATNVIQEFDEVLKLLQFASLTKDNLSNLYQCVNGFYNNMVNALVPVKDFYEKQGMKSFSKLVNHYMENENHKKVLAKNIYTLFAKRNDVKDEKLQNFKALTRITYSTL